MKKTIKLITVLLAMFFISQNAFSKTTTDTTLVRVKTIQGNEFIGTIITEDSEVLVLKTEAFGELRILKKDITLLKPIDPARMIEDVYWTENPQATRYFWTPNGYGLKKGEGYYQNIWVLYNQVSYGLSSYFSISAGIIPTFLFRAEISPVWLVPKFSLPIKPDKFNLSAGAFMGTFIGEDSYGFGILFTTATFGSRDNNANIGLGYGYGEGEWASSPILNLSYMIRTGPKGYFITENYFYFGQDVSLVLLSFGGRRMLKNVGLDFAAYLPFANDSDLIIIPFLGITIPFGDY